MMKPPRDPINNGVYHWDMREEAWFNVNNERRPEPNTEPGELP